LDLMHAKFAMMEDFLLDSKEKEELFQKENAELRNQLIQLKENSKNKTNTSSFERKMDENLAYNEEHKHPFAADPFAEPISCDPRRGIVVKVIDKKRSMIKNVETTIPSGTTVKAVLVSSVDAPCGVYSSSDPQPVKLQILDDGHLPKHVRVKLKGGVIIGSAYGDLSSERLYIRVERLTQIKPSGDFVDTTITGFITGEDGKYGVRGTVVDKSFKLIGNAAFTGMLSGVNNFFQAYASSYTNSGGLPPFCGNGDVSGKEFTYGLAAQGGTAGVDNALNALTDFYIKRADLIKPVLQVNAGRIVDLTFSMSVDIGDIHAQDKAERIRKESRI
jgi:conjugal transfer pilus assembly protein TraB